MSKIVVTFIFCFGIVLSSTDVDEIEISDASDEKSVTYWQDKLTTVTSKVKYLYHYKKYADVTLKVGNVGSEIEEFSAHALILGMASPFFEEKFLNASSKVLSLEIPDVSPRTFKQVMLYIYTDRIPDESNVTDSWNLWIAATKFKIKELIDTAVSGISNMLDGTTVWETLEKSQQNQERRLEDLCFNFISDHATHLMTDSHFHELSKQNMLRIVKDVRLNCTEIELFKALVQWGRVTLEKANKTETEAGLQPVLEDLVSFIRFENITEDDFVAYVVPSKALRREVENAYLLRFLKTPSNKKPRRKNSTRIKVSEIGCARGIHRISEDVMFEKSNYQVNSVNVRITCNATCYFTGFQITEGSHHCKEPKDLFGVTALVRFANSSKVLSSSTFSTLSSPYRINFEKPIRVKSDTDYNIYFKFGIDMSRCVKKGFLDFSQHLTVYKNFQKNVTCNNGIKLNFYEDKTLPSYTTAEKGLMPNLYFMT